MQPPSPLPECDQHAISIPTIPPPVFVPISHPPSSPRAHLHRLAGAAGVASLYCAVAYTLSATAPSPLPPACVGPGGGALGLGALLRAATPAGLGGGGDAQGTVLRLWGCGTALQAVSSGWVLALFAATYIGLQSLAIPGPLLLSLLAGPLFGPFVGQGVVACCATTGACVCYSLSSLLARPVLERCLAGRIADLRTRLDPHRDSLFSFLLFLRLSPVTPNWALNVCAPILGVPLPTFAGATLLGLLPANFFHVTAGAALAEMGKAGWSREGGGHPSWLPFLVLGLLSGGALLPLACKSRLGGGDPKSAQAASRSE